jgi:hypothetical protein
VNVVVRNNIATQIKSADTRCDHNIVEKTFVCKGPDTGPKRDARLDRNLVDQSIRRSLGFAAAKPDADLRPLPGSRAYKNGSREDAPTYDVTGRTRSDPYDIGAFAR